DGSLQDLRGVLRRSPIEQQYAERMQCRPVRWSQSYGLAQHLLGFGRFAGLETRLSGFVADVGRRDLLADGLIFLEFLASFILASGQQEDLTQRIPRILIGGIGIQSFP